jgi:hypothetical protein
MDRTVSFAGAVPTWAEVYDLLARRGFPVQTRMIDGQLSFPDEVPPENWRELRVGTPQGMVTVSREEHVVKFVTWGNADAALRQAWNAVTWAFAEAGSGIVQTETGPVSAADFREREEMPPALK